MEKFSIKGPRISGRFYPDNDINQIYNILCNIKDNIDFAQRRPDHEKALEFLKKAYEQCMEIINILNTDKPTEE